MKGEFVWRAAVALLFGALMAVCALAQADKPDFSGTWALESTASGANIPRVLSVRQVLVRTNVRGEPMPPFYKDIEITRTFADGSSSETYQIGVVGGTVSGLPGGIEGPRTRLRVAWEGQALVLEQGHYTGATPASGDWAERREEWSFDSAGRLNLTILTRGSGKSPETVALVYRRQ